jgi:hypothetical protein
MALERFRAPLLPYPGPTYTASQQRALVRSLEVYFSQLDSQTPNFAQSYRADTFFGGEFRTSSAPFTASGSVEPGTSVVLVDATAGAVTITLPAANVSAGRSITVKKTDASVNAVTIDGSGAETIDGATTKSLPAQYDSVTVFCDGTQWWIV